MKAAIVVALPLLAASCSASAQQPHAGCGGPPIPAVGTSGTADLVYQPQSSGGAVLAHFGDRQWSRVVSRPAADLPVGAHPATVVAGSPWPALRVEDEAHHTTLNLRLVLYGCA